MKEITKNNCPKTVSASIRWVRENFAQETLNNLKKMPESKLIELHHSLGRYLRNSFNMWGNNKKLLKDCLKIQKKKYKKDYIENRKYYKTKIKEIHPDDASFIIIQELWRNLNEPA